MNTLLQIIFVKPLLVGLLDAIEYTYFNPDVFYKHNFPDIVPYMDHNTLAAFTSGVVCSFPFIPFGLFTLPLKINPYVYAFISMIEFASCVAYMTNREKNIYANHIFFYKCFALGEFATILSKIIY